MLTPMAPPALPPKNYLSDCGEWKLEEEVEALHDVHVAGLNSGQILQHKIPDLKKVFQKLGKP